MARTHYDLLGIQENADPTEVKKAYRLLARMYHPDRFDAKTQAAEWERANAMLRDLSEAYATLSNPERRHAYDRGRTSPPPAEPPAWAPDRLAPRRPVRSRIRRVAFNDLPPSYQARLRLRQRGHYATQLRFALTRSHPVLITLALLLPLAWLPLLTASAHLVRWSTEIRTINFALLLASTLAFGWALQRILRWKGRRISDAVYITPGGVTEVRNDRVSFWPLPDLVDVKFPEVDAPRQLGLVLSNHHITVPLPRASDSAATAEFVSRVSKQWNHALETRNDEWFEEHDDLFGQDLPPDGHEVSSSALNRSTALAFGAPLCAAVLLALGTLHVNATAPLAPLTVRVTADRANVRAAANPTSRVAFQARAGEVLLVAGAPQGSWIPVRRGDATGFIASHLTKPGFMAASLEILYPDKFAPRTPPLTP